MKIKIWSKVFLTLLMFVSSSAYSMNKGELIDAIAGDAGLSKADAGNALNALIASSIEIFGDTGSSVLMPLGRIRLGDLGPDRTFVANGHVTVLKRNEPPSSFDGLVTVSESADTGDLELTISLNELTGSGDELDLVLTQTALKPLESDGTSNKDKNDTLALNFQYKGNLYFSVVSPTETGRGWDGTYKGKLSLIRAASVVPVLVTDTALLRNLVTTAYVDSFFDAFTADLARNIETGFNMAPELSKAAHNKLKNSAAYGSIIATYLEQASPVLIEYVDCIILAANRGEGNDNDCGRITEKLTGMLKLPIAQMIKVTTLDVDSDGDTIPDDASKIDLTITPGRLEFTLTESVNRALGVYLDKIAEELVLSVDQGQDNERDFDIVLDNAALIAGIEKPDIRRVSDSFSKIATNALKKGDKVALRGFGTFSISNRAARTGRNPQTGATIKIAAKKVAKFKAGAALAGAVN